MKSTKPKEYRDLTVPELEVKLREARESLFQSRRDLVFRRVTDTTSLKVQRHNIARIITIIEEKKRGVHGG
jgi:large subunit ribosomal protein L29